MQFFYLLKENVGKELPKSMLQNGKLIKKDCLFLIYFLIIYIFVLDIFFLSCLNICLDFY